MFFLAQRLYPQPSPLWTVVRQIGVEHAVGMLDSGELGVRALPEDPDQVAGRIGVQVRRDADGAWS